MAQSITSPKELLDQAKGFAKRDSGDFMVVRTKATVTAGLCGLVLGAMIGFYKKTNVYMSATIGCVGFGLLANQFIKNQYAQDED